MNEIEKRLEKAEQTIADVNLLLAVQSEKLERLIRDSEFQRGLDVSYWSNLKAISKEAK